MLLSADTRRGGGDRRRREEEGGGACAASMWRAVTGSCDLGSMCSTNTHTSTTPQPVVIVRLARDCVRNRLRFSRACVNACQRWQMVVWHVSVVWPWAWKHSKASELRKEHLLSSPLLSSPLLSSPLISSPLLSSSLQSVKHMFPSTLDTLTVWTWMGLLGRAAATAAACPVFPLHWVW